MLWASNVFCTTTPAIDSLASRLSDIDTFQARFIQHVLTADGTVQGRSEGQMVVKRPGLMRWETQSPFEQLLIVRGDVASIYEPDLEQLVIHSLDEQDATLATLLAEPVSTLKTHFEVDYVPNGYSLRPRDESALYASLSLHFNENLIVSIEIVDQLEQTTTISFEDVVLDPSIEEGTFNMVVPPDTEVVGETEQERSTEQPH